MFRSILNGSAQRMALLTPRFRAQSPRVSDQAALPGRRSVRKGQILFEIDPRPFQAALDQAKRNGTRQRLLWIGKSQSGTRQTR